MITRNHSLSLQTIRARRLLTDLLSSSQRVRSADIFDEAENKWHIYTKMLSCLFAAPPRKENFPLIDDTEHYDRIDFACALFLWLSENSLDFLKPIDESIRLLVIKFVEFKKNKHFAAFAHKIQPSFYRMVGKAVPGTFIFGRDEKISASDKALR